jgi:DNA-binding transcriptional LysR family regulator
MRVAMEWSDRIGRRIRLRDLHILLAVVQCKSMAKAAEQLAISRPVISRAISDLEQVLGVRLLERDRHGAEPTTYGAALLKRGVAVFHELREGVKDIECLVDPTAGEVRIGCHPFLAPTFVAAVIDRVSQRYPRIVFHLVATQVEDLHHELSERNVDLLVAQRFGPLANEKLKFEVLYEDAHVVVAGAHSPWVRRRRIKLAELANESWALPPPESALGSIVTEAFRAAGLEYPRTTVFSFPAEVRTALVATGRFLTIFPSSVLKFSTNRPELEVLPVDLPVLRMPIGIVTQKNRTLARTPQLFIEHAREVAKQLA